ncbi:TPA: hypothetical protein ACWX1L_003266 [Elizabethkingia anophelis]
MIVKKKIFIFFLLLFMVSCNSSKQEEYYKNFDIPLIKKNRIAIKNGNYKAVKNLNNQYLKIAEQKKYKEGTAICYINMANLDVLSGNAKNAISLMKKAEKILKDSDNKLHKALLYDGLAGLNRYLGMSDNALHYNAKALGIFNSIDNKDDKDYLLSNAYLKRGDYLFKKGQFDSSLVYLHRYRSLIKDIEIESLLSEFHTERNNLDSASVYHTQMLNIVSQEGYKITNYDLFLSNWVNGNYFTKKRLFNEAEVAYAKAQEAMNNITSVYGSSFNSEFYKSLTNYYQTSGNEVLTKKYAALYIQEKDKWTNVQQEAVGPTIDVFVSDIKKDDKQYKRNMWMLIILLVIVGALIGIYAYKQIKALQLKRKLLRNETDELQVQVQSKKHEEVVELAKKNDSTFLVKFQETYPEFIAKLQAINPELETSELAFSALIKLNFSSKEIAEYTYIQHASVQQRKRRLRKRLNIPSEVDLYQFFNEL